MIRDSSTSLVEQDTSMSPIYSTSDSGQEVYPWIQPPITNQSLDPSRSTLINGIYAQAVQEEKLPESQTIPSEMEAGLSAMAADPDIQQEIRQVQSEFEITEADGLADDL